MILGITPTYSDELPSNEVEGRAFVEAPAGPELYSIQIVAADPLGLNDSDRGTLAWAHATLEVGLARLPGVLPRLGGFPPPPGLDAAMAADLNLTARFELKGPDAQIELCPADEVVLPIFEGCPIVTAPWFPENPELTVDVLLGDVARILDRPHTPGLLDTPTDAYIRKIATRAVAAGQGLRQPSAHAGDIRRDPVARAVFLDSSINVVQWQAARSGIHSPMQVHQLLRRAAKDHDLAVHHAGEAWALEQIGAMELAAKKWIDVMAMAPGDRRFVLPAARAALRIGDHATAERCISQFGTHSTDGKRMRVQLADAGAGANDEQLLAWQEADSDNPEPVRRRIALRIASGRLGQAASLASELRKRGEPQVAAELEIAVAVNLGDLDRAAAIAKSAGAPVPPTTAASLMDLDDQLVLLANHLDELLSHTEELARLQNVWSENHGQRFSTRCAPEGTGLRDRARAVGTEVREEVLRARELLTVLHRTLDAPTVAPVLDPVRDQQASEVRESVLRAAHEFLAAVRFQRDQVEWRSRYCG